jgi:hypothetical protein
LRKEIKKLAQKVYDLENEHRVVDVVKIPVRVTETRVEQVKIERHSKVMNKEIVK